MFKSLLKPPSHYFIALSHYRKWMRRRNTPKLSASGLLFCGWWLVSSIAIISHVTGFGTILEGEAATNYNEFLKTIIPTQAALVGIIIPIIFALVEQLFRNQDTFFKAFLYWSRVTALIISSLFLVLFLSAQLALNIPITQLTFTFSLAWFSLNIMGAALLIFVSLSFFFPKRRFALIKRYIGHVLLPNEVWQNLNFAIRSHHDEKDLLLKGVCQKIFDRFPAKKVDFPKTEEILHHLSIPVLNNIQSGAHEEFANQFKYLIEAHAYLITESAADDNGKENFAMLSNDTFWGWEQFRNWHDPYRQIIFECVKKIEEDDRFFNTCCHYCVHGTYGRISNIAPHRITGSTIRWASMVHISLLTHINREAVQHENRNILPGQQLNLPAHLLNAYLPQLKNFIGSWEHLHGAIARNIKREDKPHNYNRLEDLQVHLSEMAYSICRSVQQGDANGARWILDAYLRWNTKAERIDDRGANWTLNRDFSSNILNVCNDLKENKREVKNNEISGAIKNYWFDNSIALFGTLWKFSSTTNSSFPREIARDLYDQKLMDTDSGVYAEHPKLSSAKNLLKSYIRFEGNHEYENYMTEKLGRDFSNPFDTGRISGRVYTGWGGNNLNHAFALLFIATCAKANNRKRLVPEYELNLISNYILEDGERYFKINTSKQQFLETLKKLPVEDVSLVLGGLYDRAVNDSYARYIKRICTIFAEKFFTYLTEQYDEYVASQPISKDLLKQRRNEAEAIAFQDIENSFPLSLFQNVIYPTQTLSMYERRGVTTCPKELFLAQDKKLHFPPEDTLSTYTNHIRQCVEQWPLSIAIGDLGALEYSPKSELECWNNIIQCAEAVRANGFTPIIFFRRSHRIFYHWESHEHNPCTPPPPANFKSEKNEGHAQRYGEGYTISFADVPVFRAGQSEFITILGLEQLQEAQFRKYADNTILDIEFEAFPDRPYEGKIIYKWEYDVVVQGDNVYKICLENIPDK